MLSEILTLPATQVFGLNTALLLSSSYLTVIVSVSIGRAVKLILSPRDNP